GFAHDSPTTAGTRGSGRIRARRVRPRESPSEAPVCRLRRAARPTSPLSRRWIMPDKVVKYDHDVLRPTSPPSRTWWMMPEASASACALEPEFHCTQRATYPEGNPRWCETCWIFRKPKILTFLGIEESARLKR